MTNLRRRPVGFGDIIVFLLVGSCSLCWTSRAQDSIQREVNWTRAVYLPEYCDFTQDGQEDSADKEVYYSLYGPAFHHTHHYCRALHDLHQAIRWGDDPGREFMYERAVRGCDYVLERSDRDFLLRPEILLNKGSALRGLNKILEATRCFHEAVMLRPDYIPAYVGLANALETAGDTEEARRILQAALAYAPDSALLKKKLSKLPGSPDSNDSE